MPVTLVEDTNWTEVYVTDYPVSNIHAILESILSVPPVQDEEFPAFFQPGYPFFMRGLTPYVVQELFRYGIHTEWHQRPRALNNYSPCPVEFGRPLQNWVVDEMLKHRYGVIDIATRFGKSFVYLQWYFRAGRPRTLIFAPTADIAGQMREDFRKVTGEPIGMVAATVQKEPDWQNLTICIENSLFDGKSGGQIKPEFLPYLAACEGRIRDECHKAGNMQANAYMAMPNCIYSWGSSATPLVGHDYKDYGLIGWHGPKRVEITAACAAAYGLLAPVNAVWLPFRHDGEILSEDYDEKYKSSVVQNFRRNQMIAWMARELSEQGKTGLIFVNYSEQGQRIANDIPGSMVVASVLISQPEADLIKRQFNSGEIKVVCCTKKWREGVTFNCDFAINAEAMQADHVTVQKLGRGLMPRTDGRPFLWVDIDDYGVKMLRRWADKRRDCLDNEGWSQTNFMDPRAFQRALRSGEL
jgi:superfamily II DNA or RNA helicase